MEILYVAELQQYLMSWIPTYCCVTNQCCFEILASDLVDLGDMKQKVIASGQVIEAFFSPDGKYWRCACEQINNIWTVFPSANTRCLFIPRMSF